MPPRPSAVATTDDDLAIRLLEWGLLGVVVIAPLPFGAVGAQSRTLLEWFALALGGLWLLRCATRDTTLPSRGVLVGVLGLLALGAMQIVPLGEPTVQLLSPQSLSVQLDRGMTDTALEAEERLLGLDPRDLETPATLSVDPSATASALRTGCALAVLLVVGVAVAAARGARRLALALLASAAFQALYGLLILASGHDRIWNHPKEFYLAAATGTYINKNHFASFVAMGLACGLALLLRQIQRTRMAGGRGLVRLLGHDGSRTLVLGLLCVIALAGLLASLSRAGIFVGLAAMAWVLFASRRTVKIGTRAAVALLVVGLAATPLLQLGSERLWDRYAQSNFDLTKAGSRMTVWGDSVALASGFPLAGAGFGTFASAYPIYRSKDVRLFYAHAHNDPLQLAAEGGLVALVFFGVLLVPLGRSTLLGLTGRLGHAGVGLAAALVAMALHSIVDFPFHIPANAATAAVLGGVLIGLPRAQRSRS